MKSHSSLQVIRDEHASLAAMLQSMRLMIKRGSEEDRRAFFDVVRAMLFYIDEFPERLHHPKESNLLFPRVVRASPQVMGAIDKLERDHMYSEKAARDLQHLLLKWKLWDRPIALLLKKRLDNMSSFIWNTCTWKRRSSCPKQNAVFQKTIGACWMRRLPKTLTRSQAGTRQHKSLKSCSV